jgi:hypothetical protein
MTLLHIAFFFVVLQFILHFYIKSINNPKKFNLIVNIIAFINFLIFFLFLDLFIKKQKPIYLLPIILGAFNYLQRGHNLTGKSRGGGMCEWVLMGGIELGILGMHIF